MVITAAERIVADLEANDTDGDRTGSMLHQLTGLLQREYTASENHPELRRRILNVIDIMLERELYGTEEILKTHERTTRPSGWL